jgi:hypothetical protein
MMLCQVAGASMRSSRHTAVATLELSEAQWVARVLANLTGLRINDVALPEREQDLIARLNGLGGLGHCEVAQFTPEVTTVREILDWVDDVEQRRGVAIETLVVDYADLLGHSRKRDYEGMREVYSTLREEFAVKRNGWVWTASQSRRKRKATERQGANDGADSQHKIRVADLWLTLDASEDGGEMSYRISKNRGGARGSIVTLPTDFATAQLAPDLGAMGDDDGSLDLF